jgi:hypothetical protein
MAGVAVATDILVGKASFVIEVADAIKNYAEANTNDLEGYLKLTSALTGFLSVPVGMAQLGSSIVTDLHGDVKVGGYSVAKVSKLAEKTAGGLGGLAGLAGIGLYYLELTKSTTENGAGGDPGKVGVGTTLGAGAGVIAVVTGGAVLIFGPEVAAGLAVYELMAVAVGVVAFLTGDESYTVNKVIDFSLVPKLQLGNAYLS